MRRKLIKQGIDGLTMYLPKKWADQKGLKAGDEVELIEVESNLVVSASGADLKQRTVELKFDRGRETALRTMVVNMYRSGYDKIIITCPSGHDELRKLVSTYMPGFEIFKLENDRFSLESVAVPSYDDFEKIVEKLFFIMIDVIERIDKDAVEEQVQQIQRYDNFLKRAISKNILTHKAPLHFWQFLSHLAQTARHCHHLNRLKDKKFSTVELSIKNDLLEMMRTLQRAYLKKDIYIAMELHDMEQNIVYEKGFRNIKKMNPMHAHYLFSIARLIFISASPLTGIISAEKD